MKPNIEEMIEGLDAGEVIPSVTGTIVALSTAKLKGKDTKRQYVTINDTEMDIILRIDDEDAQVEDGKMGLVLVATSSNGEEGNHGLTLGDKDGKPMVIVGDGAQITVQKSIGAPAPSKDKPKRLTLFEATANPIIDSKLWLYNYVKTRVLEADPEYPQDHLPAFTTSVFMDLSKAGVAIPTGTASVTEHSVDEDKKQSAVVKEGTKKPKASKKSGGWRDYVHPVSGDTLGSLDPETVKEKSTSWFYGQDRSGVSSKVVGLYDAIGEAFAEWGHTPTVAAGYYMRQYLEPYMKDQVKYNKIVKRIEKMSASYFDDDKDFVSDKKAIEFIRNFKDIFEAAIK